MIIFIFFQPLSSARQSFELVSYGDAIYALGGDGNSGEINTMHRYSREKGWVARANLPYANHRFCAVADELNDKIYMIGGYYSHAYYQTRQYKVSTNTWQYMDYDYDLSYYARVCKNM